jgi:hypothetical protein
MHRAKTLHGGLGQCLDLIGLGHVDCLGEDLCA